MSFLHIDMTQVIEILSQRTRTYLFYIVNIMGADVLAMQGARTSAAMIWTKSNRDNSVPHVKGLWKYVTQYSLKFSYTVWCCMCSILTQRQITQLHCLCSWRHVFVWNQSRAQFLFITTGHSQCCYTSNVFSLHTSLLRHDGKTNL